MFNAIKGFFKGQNPPSPEEELYNNFQQLTSGTPLVLKALHLALLKMWGLFLTKYSGITDFAYKDETEKFEYLKKLLAMENEFHSKKMLTESVACKLLGLVLANTMSGGTGKRNMDKVVRVRAIFEKFRETGFIDMNGYPESDGPRIHARRS